MEGCNTEKNLENLLNYSNSIISRYDLSLKLGAISLLLDFQNIEKFIEEKIEHIESLSPFDEIYDVDLLSYANKFENISFLKGLNTSTDPNAVNPGNIIDLLFPGELIDDNRDKAESIREFLGFLTSDLSIEDISKALSEIKSILVKELRELNELLNNKFGVETTIVDTSNVENVKKAIKPNTKLIHIETPGNPTLTISDIKAIAKVAHDNGALLSVDNTFASPYNQRPVELGADFTVESLTKYINGHGDAMGGAIIGKKKYLDIIRAQSQINLGATISPFNAWLIMRGSVTLPLRMKQHNENALKVAKYLQTVKGISFVAYPGLENHPNHQIAKEQMTNGYGGVLSFGLKADHDTYNRVVSHLNVITSAVSLGHDESLIVFLGENDERQYLYPEEFHNGFFRFSVGIEDADDIIADLQQAFEKENLV